MGKQAANGRKEVLVQGKHATQLVALQQRIAQIQNQQNQLVLASREAQGGVKVIIDFYIGENEVAVDYDSQRNVLFVEKKPQPKPEEEKK